jgi:acyl dehydratase
MVERCRFLDPVYPGDPLTLQVRVTGPDANPVCSVQAGTPAGPVAEIRLRYRDRNAA